MSGTTNFTGALGNALGRAQTYQPQMPTYPYSGMGYGGMGYGGMGYGGYQPMNPYMSGGYRPMMQPNYWNQMAYGMAGLPSYSIPRAGSYYSQPAPTPAGAYGAYGGYPLHPSAHW